MDNPTTEGVSNMEGARFLEGAIEAMLFVTDEPVSAVSLAENLECEARSVQSALESLQKRLNDENSGIQLREVAGGWRLYTHPQYHDLIERYVLSWDTRKLSGPALETLAIVAYTQPVTRQGIASIRGVNSESTLSSLIEKGLVRECGVASVPGNPTLYGTTRTFLEKFGLRSVKDLPDIEEFAPDDETRKLISARLGANRPELIESISLSEDGTISVPSQSDAAVEGDGPSSDVEEEATLSMEQIASNALASALGSALGAVEKIDFDSLDFDFDDE